MLARESALLALLKSLADPILEITDRVAPDAKFDEMKWHDGYCETYCVIQRRRRFACGTVSTRNAAGNISVTGGASGTDVAK
jgi:hypothetical protein